MNRYIFSSNKKIQRSADVNKHLALKAKGAVIKEKIAKMVAKGQPDMQAFIKLIDNCENGEVKSVNIPKDSFGNLVLENSVRAYIRKLGVIVTHDQLFDVEEEEEED